MREVTVFRFEVWDPEKRQTVVAPRMATPAAIRRVKGMADLESALVVDETALDENGFYRGKPPQTY